jgi:hypothetical protein
MQTESNVVTPSSSLRGQRREITREERKRGGILKGSMSFGT